MDVEKKKATVPWMLMTVFFLALSATFPGCFSAASQQPNKEKSTHSKAANGFASSVLFPLTGSVYPLGYYSLPLTIGHPPKVFEFDIDTGSDLTWVQCDAPCSGCTKPIHDLYKPGKHIPVHCEDPSCGAVHFPENPQCERPDDQCDFEVEYLDDGSVLGAVITDYFSLQLTNGSVIRPRLAFGCAYDLKHHGPYSPPSTDGVIGLGNGKASILSQLQSFGVIRNVIGHCLSGKGGGYLFLGDDHVPSSGIVWMPMSGNTKHFLSTTAELLLDGKPTGVTDLQIVFDSGSSYTYFCSRIYKPLLDLVMRGLNGKPLNAVHDQALPVCWKGKKPFKSVHDVKNYFSTLTLSFTNTRNVQLELPPEAYLIVTDHGNVCLGILNGTEAGVDEFSIIGDISLQNKMVIYDYEKQQIGWVSANCDRLPSSDGDYEDFQQPYAANFGIVEENSPPTETQVVNKKVHKREL
ncbi:Peptidase A1 [Corchorus olitorius]|uniref:Aspartic proteinase Asp1 n=1 Tax=Corchorus olitorius TaxID=93759 RepID=A0A1R3I7C7_9ROSI|nr:Peptidase A1 [Corchorus olitorius]